MKRAYIFKGMIRKDARTLVDLAKGNMHQIVNMQTRTGAMRRRRGLSGRLHDQNNTLIWPDAIGRFRPFPGYRDYNFALGWYGVPWNSPSPSPSLFNFSGSGFSVADGGSGSTRKTRDIRTWRFRHIVLSINDRLHVNNLPPSSLSTWLPDQMVTYDHINKARKFCEAFATGATLAASYFSDAASHTVQRFIKNNIMNRAVTYDNYHNLLYRSDVGGGEDGDDVLVVYRVEERNEDGSNERIRWKRKGTIEGAQNAGSTHGDRQFRTVFEQGNGQVNVDGFNTSSPWYKLRTPGASTPWRTGTDAWYNWITRKDNEADSREWSNIADAAQQVIEYRNDMLDTDDMGVLMFSELETVLRNLIATYASLDVATDSRMWYYSARDHSTPEEAWDAGLGSPNMGWHASFKIINPGYAADRCYVNFQVRIHGANTNIMHRLTHYALPVMISQTIGQVPRENDQYWSPFDYFKTHLEWNVGESRPLAPGHYSTLGEFTTDYEVTEPYGPGENQPASVGTLYQMAIAGGANGDPTGWRQDSSNFGKAEYSFQEDARLGSSLF